MTSPGQVYLVVVAVLLLLGLAVSIPVLFGIFRDGVERQRERRAGEAERYIEDPEYDRGPPAAVDDADAAGEPRLTCRHCGAVNEAGFRYCRRCAEPL